MRKFSLLMSYISFFFRILMALVFWKDSLDFERIMLRKKGPEIEVDSGRSSSQIIRRSPKHSGAGMREPGFNL